MEATTHPDYKVRFSAVVALGDLGPKAEIAVPNLIIVLSDDVSDVRTAAAYALRDIGPTAILAIPELVKMMQTDEADSARTAAADALGRLNDTSVVPLLVEVLYDENAGQSLSINAARSIAYLTNNNFTDSSTSSQGYQLSSDGIPVIVVNARAWWEAEGQYLEWPVVEP
ncbi:MAG: HEAT repeat domain-containing protein [Anaerolineae bacterium]|nr:HEAT repeat domain-containing protein [Anaerolineae bacterium]